MNKFAISGIALCCTMLSTGVSAQESMEMSGHERISKTIAEPYSAVYTLDTCPVSGGKLGSMGDPIVKTYDGREVRFCCGGCIGKFEADKEGYWERINKAMVKDQLTYYPITTCIISGEPLVVDGESIARNMVYNNRLVRFCCKSCESEFKADPAASIEKLDERAADAQREHYPLSTCVVAGGDLGSMGEPFEMIVAGRLLRLCCGGCEGKVNADPAKYIAMIDLAWQEQGEFLPTDEHDEHPKPKEDGEHGDHGDHGDHGGH